VVLLRHALKDAQPRAPSRYAARPTRIVDRSREPHGALSSYDAPQRRLHAASTSRSSGGHPAPSREHTRLESGILSAAPGPELSGRAAAERRYITGLTSCACTRILILLDVSAIMLHQDLVSILGCANQANAHKRAAAKLLRAELAIADLAHVRCPASFPTSFSRVHTHSPALVPGPCFRCMALLLRSPAIQSLLDLVSVHGTRPLNAFARRASHTGPTRSCCHPTVCPPMVRPRACAAT